MNWTSCICHVGESGKGPHATYCYMHIASVDHAENRGATTITSMISPLPEAVSLNDGDLPEIPRARLAACVFELRKLLRQDPEFMPRALLAIAAEVAEKRLKEQSTGLPTP